MNRKLLSAYQKLDPDGIVKTLVLGVSGGADSIALLVSLAELRKTLGVELVAVHLNHKTRGEESDGDASFVRKICRKLGVRCVSKTVDVPALARRKQISLEMAAREVRYKFFKDQAVKMKHPAIVTAHTKDDQAETLILKLARGAGMAGLSGITPIGCAGGVKVLRPMLGIARKEIEVFLRAKGVEWREDSSNTSQSYLRNRVRARVLPMLEEALNPDIMDALARTADVVREDDALLNALAEEALSVCRSGRQKLLIKELQQKHRSLFRRVLMLWLIDCGVEQPEVDLGLISEIEKLINGRKANASTAVTGGFIVTREYGVISIGRSVIKKFESFRQSLRVPGEVMVESAGLVFRAELTSGVIKERGRPGQYPARATISAERLGKKRLVVRSVKDGDRIRPLGMNGSRKLKDVFIDLKIPMAERKRLPVVECAGEIVWVPGYRVARGWGVEEGDVSIKLCMAKL